MKMKTDHERSKEDLILELGRLREEAAAIPVLKQRLTELESANNDLEKRCADQMESFRKKCAEKKQFEEKVRLAKVIIDKSPVILFRRMAGDDPSLTFVSSNIRQFGYSSAEFLEGSLQFKDIVHPDDVDRLREEVEAHAEKRSEAYNMSYRIVTRNGEVRWIEDQTSTVKDEGGNITHYQGIVVDITRIRLAEEKLKKSEEKFRRIVETAGEGFMMMDDDLMILDINDAYCKMLGYDRSEVLGRSSADFTTEEFKRLIEPRCEEMLRMEYRKFEGTLRAKNGRIVPVLIHGNNLRDSDGEKLGNVSFVADLTEQKRALALAGKVQRSLIPSSAPLIDGLDIAGKSNSCEEVGGDYFDFLFGPGFSTDTLKVVVGDISGHGVDAALMMTSARAFIRTRATQPGSPSGVVTAMNRDLSTDMGDTGHFMTLFFMEIDPKRGTVQWVRAGHDPALLYSREEDRFDELVGTGLPLGVDGEFSYADNALADLAPGTVIALGTDGIWEAGDLGGEPFGKERFRRVIRENADKTAEEIVAGVFEELDRYTHGTPPQDDVTLVVVKVDAAAGSSVSAA